MSKAVAISLRKPRGPNSDAPFGTCCPNCPSLISPPVTRDTYLDFEWFPVYLGESRCQLCEKSQPMGRMLAGVVF
eukprot:5663551-Pyramimonas_sp.AAC.1